MRSAWIGSSLSWVVALVGRLDRLIRDPNVIGHGQLVTPPTGGSGLGADSADVRGLQTTRPAGTHPTAPRVIARQAWIEGACRAVARKPRRGPPA